MFTGHSVGARHLAIKPVIGTFEEEDGAFDKMMLCCKAIETLIGLPEKKWCSVMCLFKWDSVIKDS